MGAAISVPVVIALLVGIAVGLAAGYVAFPQIREAKKLRVQLETLLKEYEEYKSTVSAHFRKTGELVGEMTRSYAAVYDHLASGARNFGVAPAETALPFGPSPGLLAPNVIETAGDAPVANDLAPSTAVAAADVAREATIIAAAPNDADLAPAPTDAAMDGSMLAAEIYTEAAVDSSSETTTSHGRSADRPDLEARKA